MIQIIQRVGVSAAVRYHLGLAMVTTGRHRDAAAQLELALSDCSNDAAAAAQLAACYVKTGREQDAQILAVSWTDATPSDAEADETTVDPDTPEQAA